MIETAALIVAGGRGVRAGGGDIPKQYRAVGGRSILRRSIDLFLDHPRIDRILCVIGPGDEGRYRSIAPSSDRLMTPAEGGETRQESVRRGLMALAREAPRTVLIHDAARPFATPRLIDRVIGALRDDQAVVPGLAVADTLKAVDEKGRIVETIPREGLFSVATPQGFRFEAILAAHELAAKAAMSFTDDAGVAEWAGHTVRIVQGEATNMKLTTAADIEAADRRLRGEAALALGDVRVATGYDVHSFGPGDHVMLGGVRIPHERGVVGHSDGDVALHALTDALLGTIADGDIGVHFPPSDPEWKGASSDRFLRFAAERVRARGGAIAHLDVAIVCEAPRVAAHRDSMRQRIAEIAGIAPDRVGIKATTNEKLGFLGRGEGLAAIATATVRLPFGEAT